MKIKQKIALMFIIFTFLLSASYMGQVQAEESLNQFGNVDWNAEWNMQGGVVIASQFTIQNSITITMMSVYTRDVAPTSYCRLGILSDNDNAPYQCLASTAVVPAQVSAGWQTVTLSEQITLQPGKYWLAHIDSGAGVIKYIEQPGSNPSISRDMESTHPWVFFSPLDVGNIMPEDVEAVDGTLAIVASFGPPDFDGSPEEYAMGAQCWTSGSAEPYPVQPTFTFGERVYVHWTPYEPSSGAVDIKVYKPGDTPGVDIPDSSFSGVYPDSSPISFAANLIGTWTITCNGYSTTITVVPVLVNPLPESPVGSLLLVVACFSMCALLPTLNRRTKIV